MKKLHAVAAALFLLAPVHSFAATTGAVFTGAVLSTCSLVAGTPGIVAPSADYTAMSSHNAGGQSSAVSATATASIYRITTQAPSGFSVGPGDANTNTSFTSSYALSGSTNAVEVDGATSTALNTGISAVTVNMAATKSSGVFSVGAYTATVTVRCE